MLTAQELAAARQAVAQFTEADIVCLANAVQRSMAAVDAHAQRATDHIADMSDRSK